MGWLCSQTPCTVVGVTEETKLQTETRTRLVKRLNLSDLSPGACPAFRTRKPGSRVKTPRQRTVDAPFLLGAIREGVIRRLLGGKDRNELQGWLSSRFPRLTSTESEWLLEAIGGFPDPSGDGLRILEGPVVLQKSCGECVWELTAWGIWAASDDGEQRRIYLLRYSDHAAPYELARIAAAALCAANGVSAETPRPWEWHHQPHRLRDNELQPRHIEVVEYFVGNRTGRERFSGPPSLARTLYDTNAKDAARTARKHEVRRPGRDCDGCALIPDCPEVPTIRGLLGVSASGADRGTWSATNGRYYSQCPRRDHLHRQHLPGAPQSIPEQVGRAVDARLTALHRRGRTCTLNDVPWTAADWRNHDFELSAEQSTVAATALSRHASELCPLRNGASIESVQPVVDLIAFDPDCNTVVHAQPDLLYREEGEWVWRETKVTQRLPWTSEDLLAGRHRIQLAIAVLMMSDGVLGEAPASRVELETLNDGGCDIEYIDVTDPAEVDRAREVISAVTAPWRVNRSTDTNPGEACRWCPYANSCPDAAIDGGSA
ncbi:PD-(D/E)XK nuclease superfamily protein [Stackebrandtia endophytica]|uniref:PD-(D/E)XK nuclease superfamily protein n=1 Tax=Stackebrandtia endophytica TaxID=1496996 RepID=A0A543ARD9_9ACTN|nr:PD-(D/E)XK nuclease family protein [Stackebrandtia endophytica]TQL75147.1 PD-(D/E)XK nuclease superfamily protein [Stackebrandtia endophytica]